MSTPKFNLANLSVFILGAGLGTRLRPITDTIPKVMVPISPGLPLLEYTIRNLAEQGFQSFCISTHYLPEIITTHFEDGLKFGVSIRYSHETGQLLDTAGAMKPIENWLSDPFILIYGDQLHYLDFTDLVKHHHQNQALVTTVLKRSDAPQNGDIVQLDPKTNKVINWIARPHAIEEFISDYYLNSGIYVMNKRILRKIPAEKPVNLDKEILPPLVKNHEQIFGYFQEEPVLDIGTPEKLEYAKSWFAKKFKAKYAP